MATTGCTTGSVPANSTYHRVNIDVESSSFCASDYYVHDVRNGVTVASGRVGSGHQLVKTITGLYSSYNLQITHSCFDALGVIDNN